MSVTFTWQGRAITFEDDLSWSGDERLLDWVARGVGSEICVTPTGPRTRVDLSLPVTVLAWLEEAALVTIDGDMPDHPREWYPKDDVDAVY